MSGLGRGEGAAAEPVLSIVVPMFNEADGIGLLVAALHRVLGPLGRAYELVLVDDGSPDGTAGLVAGLAAADARIVPVLLARNFGKEAALAAGMEAARGQAVVFIDADMQHPPELIPELVARWDAGFEVVNAVKRSRGREGLAYRASAGAFYALLGRAIAPDFDRQSDFKLLDRQVVDAVAACGERTRFFRGLVAWVGFRVAEVPFEVAERAAGASGWSIAQLLRYAVRNLLAFTSAPLVAIAGLGFVTTAAAALLAVQTLWNWARGVAVSGFTTTILAILLVGGAILICLGVIAMYLAVVYDELKRRPLYVVRRERSEAAQARSSRSETPEIFKPASSPEGQ